MTTLGNRLRLIRESMGLTQNAFSKLIGCTRESIAHYEKDSRTPNCNTLRVICEKCHVSPAWVLGMDEQAVNVLYPPDKAYEICVRAMESCADNLLKSIAKVRTLKENG